MWEGWNGNEAENVFKNKKLDVFRRQKGSNILLSAVTEWVFIILSYLNLGFNYFSAECKKLYITNR